MKKDNKIKALILSGGGIHGAWQVGVLKKLLYENENHYDIICGTSVGAINALGLVQFKKGQEKESYKYLEDLWLSINNDSVKKHRWIPYISSLWSSSIYKTTPLRKFLEDHFDYNKFHSSGKKLRIEAASLTRGRIRVWTEKEKDIITAAMASCAFPGLLEPVIVDDEYYVDGGIMNVSPIQSAIDAGATEVDVVLTETKGVEIQRKNFKTIDVLLRTLSVVMSEIVENDLNVNTENITVYRPPEPLPGSGLDFDPKIIKEEIELGYSYMKGHF